MSGRSRTLLGPKPAISKNGNVPEVDYTISIEVFSQKSLLTPPAIGELGEILPMNCIVIIQVSHIAEI